MGSSCSKKRPRSATSTSTSIEVKETDNNSVSPFTITVEDSTNGMYTGTEHEVSIVEGLARDNAITAAAVGAATADLHKLMAAGRDDIRKNQDKLNSSLNTPLVEKELKVLENSSWVNEKKDLNKRFNLLPPIASGNKVKPNSLGFTVE